MSRVDFGRPRVEFSHCPAFVGEPGPALGWVCDVRARTERSGEPPRVFPAGRGGDSSFTLADVDVSWSDGATLSARISKPSATSVSTDATLASLTVPGARLSPAFDAGVLVYRAAVDAGVGTVTVQASATDGGATVRDWTPCS